MKALGICGSARRGGNTDMLIQEALMGAASQGAETEEVFLNELSIGPCRGCTACKDQAEQCVIDDDFTVVMEKVKAADLLVIGSPVYMGQVTGQTKTFLDRLYSLRRRDRTIRIDGTGKRGVTVVVCGATDPMHPEPAVKTVGVFFRFLNTPDVVSIVEQGLGRAGEVGSRVEALACARKVGEELVVSLKTVGK